MVNLEYFLISISYSNSQRRGILLELLPDVSNIADVSKEHNITVKIISDWHKMSEHVLGAYRLDEHRNAGFLLANISD